jgi:hypothetical protein
MTPAHRPRWLALKRQERPNGVVEEGGYRSGKDRHYEFGRASDAKILARRSDRRPVQARLTRGHLPPEAGLRARDLWPHHTKPVVSRRVQAGVVLATLAGWSISRPPAAHATPPKGVIDGGRLGPPAAS